MTTNIYERVQEILKLRTRYFELLTLSHTVPFTDPQYDDIILEKTDVSKKISELGYTDEGMDTNATMINILVYAFEHPASPFTHERFDADEYLYYMSDTGYIYDENNNIFETWIEGQGYNGILTRGYDDRYDTGWKTYQE